MRLSVKHPLIQTQDIRLAEQQIEILQRFSQPEAFLRIILHRRGTRDVVDGRVAELRVRVFLDRLEHGPARIAVVGVPCYAVEVEDRFYGFGAGRVLDLEYRRDER